MSTSSGAVRVVQAGARGLRRNGPRRFRWTISRTHVDRATYLERIGAEDWSGLSNQANARLVETGASLDGVRREQLRLAALLQPLDALLKRRRELPEPLQKRDDWPQVEGRASPRGTGEGCSKSGGRGACG